MRQLHFIVDSARIDELAQEFCIRRRTTEACYEESGASAEFMRLGQEMTKTYIQLYEALGLTQGYAKTADGKRGRLLRVERSMGRTMLTVPESLVVDCDGIKQISSDVYETMREEANTAMGVSTKALAATPHSATNG